MKKEREESCIRLPHAARKQRNKRKSKEETYFGLELRHLLMNEYCESSAAIKFLISENIICNRMFISVFHICMFLA